jgi:hypothetical protein
MDFTIREVEWFDLIDITTFVHLDEEATKKCHLYHEKTYTDYLEHVFYLHHNLFELSTWILLERQPPQGYVVVEQLIFSKYRNKTILISPNSVHSFFGWTKLYLDYDQRKEKSVEIANKYIRKELLDKFGTFVRQHDIADTICMVVYWCHKSHKKWLKEEDEKRIQRDIQYARENGLYHDHIFLDTFKYNDMI